MGNPIVDFIEWLDGLVWGTPMIILLLGTGVALSIYTGFVQLSKFGLAWKTFLRYRGYGGEKGISPFAVWAAISGATIGIGNIAGVSTAMYFGGPGALFWMFITGLLGMVTKSFEATLGAWSRRIRPDGEIEGGTPYYIRLIPAVGPVLAVLFSVFAWIAAFGIGNTAQANNSALGAEYIAWSINPQASKQLVDLVVGIIMMIFVAIVVIGGLKRIADLASYMVPFMAAWYLIFGVIIWIVNPIYFAKAIVEILKGAFAPQAVVGGVAGWTLLSAIRWGVARGLFSNEAGLGSAPNMYAYMKLDHPGRAAMYGMTEVFMDTLVVCMMTGLVNTTMLVNAIDTTGYTYEQIIYKGVLSGGEPLKGAKMAMWAFSQFYGNWAGVIVGVALFLFAFTTLLSWEWYGEVNWVYFWSRTLKLPEKPARWVFRVLWVLPILPAAYFGTEVWGTIWDFSDMMNGLMALPNIIALAVLSPIAWSVIKDFIEKHGKTGV
jgi:AGCS family alanine or glycine:cation symporter